MKRKGLFYRGKSHAVAGCALFCALGIAAIMQLRAEGDATLTDGWKFSKDPSRKADWSAEALDDSAWQQVRVPHDWAISGPFKTNEFSGSSGRLPWKGVGNGDPCEHVSFTSLNGHRLFGGVVTAVVRRTGPGAIAVKASSPTLKGASATLDMWLAGPGRR